MTDGRSDLGPEAAGDGSFVADEQPAGLVDRRLDRAHVPGQQRPQVDDLAGDAVRRRHLFCLRSRGGDMARSWLKS